MLRIPALLSALCLIAMPAIAQDASTKDVYACKDVGGDTERLACYDAAVGRLKAAEEAGEVTTVTRTEVEKVRRDSFGFSIPSLPSFGFNKTNDKEDAKNNEIKDVTQAVASITGSRGALRVRLENGQVWVQTDSKKVRNRKQGKAFIYQASMGSYKMKLDGGLAFRVRREK